jgi:mono/diheme cytochrome c family protein
MTLPGYILALAVLALPAQAQTHHGDPDEGARLAGTWCTNCHLVTGSRTGGDAVPSFAAIAARPGATEEAISTFLRTPHATMPDHGLTLQQSRDLAAFVMRQRRDPGRAGP